MAVMFFGQYLVERGIVSRGTLLKAIQLQESVNLSFGEIAISMGYLTARDIERIHLAQRSEDERFGDIAVKLGLLVQEQLQQVLTRQKNNHLYIGEAIMRVGGFSEGDLVRYLDEFKADQAPYLTDRVTIPVGVPHPEIWEMAADLTYKMLTRVARLTFRPEPCRTAVLFDKNDIAATIAFTGDVSARYFLAVSRGVQVKIAEAMLNEVSAEGETQEVLDDTVMEFVNVVCGNIAAKAAPLGKCLEITPPEILGGSGSIEVQPGQTGLIFPICLADGDRAEFFLFVDR